MRFADAEIPAFDILCAGFPCQPFSIAGVSKKLSLGRKHGFDDEKQGNLFFRIADVLNYHQPRRCTGKRQESARTRQGPDVSELSTNADEGARLSSSWRVIDAPRACPAAPRVHLLVDSNQALVVSAQILDVFQYKRRGLMIVEDIGDPEEQVALFLIVKTMLPAEAEFL